jgi:hypothetical protein
VTGSNQTKPVEGTMPVTDLAPWRHVEVVAENQFPTDAGDERHVVMRQYRAMAAAVMDLRRRVEVLEAERDRRG